MSDPQLISPTQIGQSNLFAFHQTTNHRPTFRKISATTRTHRCTWYFRVLILYAFVLLYEEANKMDVFSAWFQRKGTWNSLSNEFYIISSLRFCTDSIRVCFYKQDLNHLLFPTRTIKILQSFPAEGKTFQRIIKCTSIKNIVSYPTAWEFYQNSTLECKYMKSNKHHHREM